MSFTVQKNNVVSYSLDGGTFVPKMSHLLKACDSSTGLMVGIYLVKRNDFFYCNNRLKEVLGGSWTNLIENGWNFLDSVVVPKELGVVKKKISDLFTAPYLQDALTLKYHISLDEKNFFIKHEILMCQLEENLLAINYFFDITEKEKIEYCIETAPKRINSSPRNEEIFAISPREKQVLRLIADGFSSKEIADMLFISNHTAISHRKNLIEKFQVKNTAHLIKRASSLICL